MSAVSAADNSFLALSYIGMGEKYGDAPDFIHAAFETFSMPPSIINTIILPKPAISVLALADTPLQVLKAPEKAMEMAVDGENVISDGEDAVFDWT